MKRVISGLVKGHSWETFLGVVLLLLALLLLFTGCTGSRWYSLYLSKSGFVFNYQETIPDGLQTNSPAGVTNVLGVAGVE